MSARLRERVEKLEDGNDFPRNDEWFREQLRLHCAASVDAIPAGEAGAVYFEQMGRDLL